MGVGGKRGQGGHDRYTGRMSERDTEMRGSGGNVETGAGPWHPLDAIERQRRGLTRILRAAFVVFALVITGLAALGVSPDKGNIELRDWPLYLALGIATVALVLAIDFFTPKKKISTVSAVFFGLLTAMLATLAFSYVIDVMAFLFDIRGPQGQQSPIIATTKVLVGVALTYLTITTVLQTQDDFRLIIPYVEFAKQLRGAKPLVLDSSALIDARVVDVMATRMVQSAVIVPRFVIAELQTLADSGDRLQRTKGRRGLDMVTKLQRLGTVDVVIDEMLVPGVGVDQMLVEFARRTPAIVVTTDLGLARIAEIGGVPVVNMNDLASALKPALVPGESLSVQLVKPGEQHGQAVGYLDDGTMVVAEDGAELIGQRVTLVVTSTLQTSAGRLIFGRRGGAGRVLGGGVGVGAGGNGGDERMVISGGSSSTTDGGSGTGGGEAPATAGAHPTEAGGAGGTSTGGVSEDGRVSGDDGARPDERVLKPRNLRDGTPRNPRRN